MYHMTPNVQWNYTVGWIISFVKLKLNNYDFFYLNGNLVFVFCVHTKMS